MPVPGPLADVGRVLPVTADTRHLFVHLGADLLPGRAGELARTRPQDAGGLLNGRILRDTPGEPFDLLIAFAPRVRAQHVTDRRSREEPEAILHCHLLYRSY